MCFLPHGDLPYDDFCKCTVFLRALRCGYLLHCDWSVDIEHLHGVRRGHLLHHDGCERVDNLHKLRGWQIPTSNWNDGLRELCGRSVWHNCGTGYIS